jgi:hypothetical protein
MRLEAALSGVPPYYIWNKSIHGRRIGDVFAKRTEPRALSPSASRQHRLIVDQFLGPTPDL